MKLKRTNDRYLAGVCGGIAEYLKVDPFWVRFIWAALTLVSFMFVGLIVYIILWIIMEPPDE